jgi:predicted dehydrogenase
VHTIETEDTAVATLVFANGALATIQATTAASTGQPRRVEIIGSKATLTFSESTTSVAVANHVPHQRIIEDFVAAMREGRRPICDGVEGRRSVEVVEAIYASAR